MIQYVGLHVCVLIFSLSVHISFLQYPDGLSSPKYEYEWSMCGSDCAQEICRRLRQVNELGARVGIKQEEALRALQTEHPPMYNYCEAGYQWSYIRTHFATSFILLSPLPFPGIAQNVASLM